MATKPDTVVRWSTDESNESVPSAGQMDTGIVASEAANSSRMNWLLRYLGLWTDYLDGGILDGAFGLKGLITPSAITGANANYAPTDFADAFMIRQDLSAAASISGLAAPSDGRMVVLVNLNATYDLQLVHDATSTAANRFTLPEGKDLYLVGAGSYAVLWYDTTSDRWRVIATNGRQSKTKWIHGADFTMGDSSDAMVKDRTGNVNTSGSAAGAICALDLPVGTRLTEILFWMETGAVNFTHSGTLSYADPAEPSNAVDIGSGSTTTESSVETFTLSGMPYTLLDFPYDLSTVFQNGDNLLGVKVTYY
jgi:hypothetical protein